MGVGSPAETLRLILPLGIVGERRVSWWRLRGLVGGSAGRGFRGEHEGISDLAIPGRRPVEVPRGSQAGRFLALLRFRA
jgi:hypothetical protein